MPVSGIVYKFLGSAGVIITQSVIFSIVFRKKIKKVLHSSDQEQNFLYFIFTVMLTIMQICLSILSYKVDFSCGDFCFKLIKMGMTYKRIKSLNNPIIEESIVQNKYIVTLEIISSIIALYFVIKLFSQKPKKLSNEQDHYIQYFKIDQNNFKLLQSIANSEQPFHLYSSEDVIFGLDHLCPWTGRNISHQNMEIFIKFLLFTSISSILRLVKAIRIFIKEYKILRYHFPNSNKLLLIPSLYLSVDGNQIIVYFMTILSILFSIVATSQLIFQLFFNSRCVVNTSLRSKVFDLVKKVKNKTYIVCLKDEQYIVLPLPQLKKPTEVELWKASLGEELDAKQIQNCLKKCTIIQKFKYLQIFKNK